MAFTWKDAPDLMIRLQTAQNHRVFAHQDILTWAAMCATRDELERHVENCETRIACRARRRSRKAA